MQMYDEKKGRHGGRLFGCRLTTTTRLTDAGAGGGCPYLWRGGLLFFVKNGRKI